MKILDVEIDNFLAITHAHIKLADRGLVLIQGENQQDTSAQSNGSGKSSIADALCWVLYGVTARGVTGNDVVNDEVGKNCSVVVNIQDGDTLYKIERYRKHSVNKNSLLVSSQEGFHHNDLTKGTDKLTQDVVNAIIGTSLDVFRGSIYAGQEMMPNLPAMTDKQLKLLIEEAAGIEILEKASEIARERLKKENYVLQSINNEIEKANERVSYTEQNLLELEERKQKWHQQVIDDINTLQAKARTSIAEADDLEKQLAGLDKPAIESEITNTNNRLAAVDKENSKLSELKTALATKNAELAQLLNKQSQITIDANAITDEITTVSDLIGKPCTECGRVFDLAHIQNKSDALKKRLNERNKTKDDIEAAVGGTHKECLELKKNVEDYERLLTNPGDLVATLQNLHQKLDNIVAVENKKKLLMQAAKSIVDQIKSLKAAICPFDEQIDKSKKELETAKHLAKQMTNRLEDQEACCRAKQIICEVFNPAGVRARILDDVTPFLNVQTEKYLSTLSDGNIKAIWTTLAKSASGGLKEKFTIEVEKEHCAQSFKGLSGGEKRKVRIAAALALQDLVATRATKPIDLFIGDEIDDALDPAGLERLTMILEEKARECGSVFIISHNELRDHVDQVLTIQKLADGTTNILEA